MIRQKLFQLIGKSTLLHKLLANEVFYAVRTVRRSINFGQKWGMGAALPSLAILGLNRTGNEPPNVTAKEVLLAKADALFEQGEYQQIYDILQNYRDNKDVEILWRLSRALYNMAKVAEDAEAKKMIYEGYNLLVKALEIKDDNYAVHKWIAVLLDKKSTYEGKKARIRELKNVKNHMLRAMDLNPKDATTLYMLGNWCYQVSDLAWYQRKMAAAIFAEPPTSSFEEALQFFERAEQSDPKFYSHNVLMLGKTYLKLNRKEEAVNYLKQASEFPSKNDDDQKAKQEATRILKSI